MEIEITRGIKNGNSFKTIYVDGEERTTIEASRMLTRTTMEDGAGIFNQLKNTKYYFGSEEKVFHFNELDFYSDSSKIIKEELINRIKKVREWVDSIDYEETFKFNV